MYAWHCILDKVSEGVERESPASLISHKIYDTFDRSAVKTNKRLFVSFSHTKAYNFPIFINIFF